MASSGPQNRASTHTSEVVRGTHEFHIVGSASVANSTIKSSAFLAGGHTWELACRFEDKGQFESISLELLGADITKDVMAVAGIRVGNCLGEWLPGVCPNDGANVFSTTPGPGRSWKLWEPRSKRVLDYYSIYPRDDRLTVHCTVDVLQEYSPTALETRKCFVSMVPLPTISQDFHKLLPVNKSEGETRQCCVQPDVTFVVEQTEIQAHKLVLAMRSRVFAAEFSWHMNENSTSMRLTVDDMTASTFSAMLSFIYTDELTMNQSSEAENYAERTMALDLLVAADRYDLERLRLMCENILSKSLDATNVISTLLLVRGRHSCRQLEDFCIEFIASDPDICAGVLKTEEYQEIRESCSPLTIEIMERVARHNVPRNPSSGHIRRLPPEKSSSTYDGLEEVHATHAFKISNFCDVQRSHVAGQSIKSDTFQVGGYDWVVVVYPSGEKEEDEGNISVYLRLRTHPPAHGVKVSSSFKFYDPTAKSLMTLDDEEPVIYEEKGESWGYHDFITSEFSKSEYLAYDGSLTIYFDVVVTKEPYTSRSMPTTSAMITVPESNITMYFGQLLVSEQGSDVSFQVEDTKIRAHSLLIAARSPVLYKEVSASVNKYAHVVPIDGMKVTVFKALLHFLYTDEVPTLGSVVVARDMLEAAYRFDNDRMKAICENFLAEHISKDNVLDTLKVAHRHHCLKLEDYCIEYIFSLPQLAKDVMKKLSLD